MFKIISSFINYDKYKKEFITFKEKKTNDKNNKIINNSKLTKKYLVYTIKNSTLNNILKDSLLVYLKDIDIKEIILDNYIICHLDSCLEFYEKSTKSSYLDNNGNEKKMMLNLM
jgi:primase-polymerase (primpol)-like protein